MDIMSATIKDNRQCLNAGNGYEIESHKLDIYDFIEFLENLGYHVRVKDETGGQWEKLPKKNMGGVFGSNPITIKDLKNELEKYDDDLVIINGLSPFDESVSSIKLEDIVYWAENVSGSVLMIR